MSETIGVVLLNLGGPDTLDDVEPFLFNLFSDRQIIRLSPFPFLQKFIAKKIAAKRAPKSRESYRLIGGGSPLARITSAQGQAMEQLLAEHGAFKVRMAMRYWHPSARETLAMFAQAGISRIVALTLYPHYSKATTGSSLDDLRQAASTLNSSFEIVEVSQWPTQPDYIGELAATINEGLAKLTGREVEVVYSAHSLPVQFIKDGDPYLDQIKETISAVERITGKKGNLCFQSRSGPVEWLSPSAPDMLAKLAAGGVKDVLLVPISFISDHVETLYEIDIQYRELAESLGLGLTRVESLNTRPRFIKGLASLVLAAIESGKTG
ncbi:MAG: ferrochelatase [Desulfobulbaceae bacterium]|nr:ferrochelatase [Desulfobulbaceae bacterium]HIJ78272.1 ferrochelatase [Deltaproteobacteria bacterium]